LLFSAKTDDSLNRVRRLYAELFEGHPDVNLADVAYTLAVGRRHHAYRDYVVCANGEEAQSELRKAGAGSADSSPLTSLDTGVVFMFPGQGSQFVNMGLSLYSEEPVFRRSVDVCCDILREHLDRDLRDLLFPDPADEVTAAQSLKNTYYTQPALFVIEYSLAQLWMNRLGVSPVAVVGHSVGEFVCACLSGVFSLEDVLPMVALRGRLIRGLPAGSMLSVRCPADGVRQRLPADIQLAASNSPSLSVVAGPSDSIAAFSAELEREGVISQQLHTSHAFHSAMMDPIVGEFVEAMSRVRFSKMRVPMVSTCTADWLTDDVASSPEYWGRHLRMPVLFSDAVSRLLADPARVFLEVGPREVLTTLARQHVDLDRRGSIVSSMGGKADPGVEWATLLAAAGSLWTRGVGVDWSAFYDGQRRQRLALPTYPFERDSHWVEPVADHRRRVQASPQSVAKDFDDESTGRAGTGTGEDESGGSSRADRAGALDKRDEVMTVLGALLKETLGVQLDSRREDMPFIALGADSLLLMQLSRAVKTRLGLSVSFRQLVEQYSTPRQLAEAARAIRPDALAPTAEPAPAEPTEELRQGPDRRRQGVGGPENARDARVGMDAHGNKAWFIPDQDRHGEYLMVAASK
jgi:acyl transferase domain-containing protein